MTYHNTSLSVEAEIETAHGNMFVSAISDGTHCLGAVLRPANLSVGPLFVRIQSSCLFSEAFGATDCDCAIQLRGAIAMARAQGGVVIYLYEEGRGAGLAKKIEAIAIQKRDCINTAQAFESLGMAHDLRDMGTAAWVLKKLVGTERAILLATNNPHKATELSKHGFGDIKMHPVPLSESNPRIKSYLREKAECLGHGHVD